jgi:hypothetical protein
MAMLDVDDPHLKELGRSRRSARHAGSAQSPLPHARRNTRQPDTSPWSEGRLATHISGSRAIDDRQFAGRTTTSWLQTEADRKDAWPLNLQVIPKTGQDGLGLEALPEARSEKGVKSGWRRKAH